MKTYKFKLYKTKKQKYLHNRVEVAGEIYNHLIALQKRYYRRYGKYIDKYRMQKHITKIKKYNRFSYWSIVGSQAIQDIIFRIDYGYQKFFKGDNKRPPTFHKIRKFKSFTLTQAGWRLCDDSIKIGRYVYKFWKSQEILGNPKCVHIKRDTLGDFYVYIVTDFEQEKPEIDITSGEIVGADFGLKTFLFMSNENNIESPEFFKKSMNKIAKANRNLSSKQKYSNNRKKANKMLSRTHKKVANRRSDWQWKTAKELCEKYSAIFLEDLDIASMKKRWGRKVSDLAFYKFVQVLKHQSHKTGTLVYQIDRYTPTTKTCSDCGHITEGLTLKDREWTCISCGTHHNRDLNAARIIRAVGISTVGLGNIRRGDPAFAV